jgi:hypothetical protein
MKTLERLANLTIRLVAVCGIAAGAPALAPGHAEAAPLDKAACARLAQDIQNIKALDVDKLMENGPAWAVSHLSTADLALVRQYIDLDEEMKFRCSAPGSLVHLKHLEDEDDENGAKLPTPDAAAEGGPQKEQGAADQGEGAPSGQPENKGANAPAKSKRPVQGSGDAR